MEITKEKFENFISLRDEFDELVVKNGYDLILKYEEIAKTVYPELAKRLCANDLYVIDYYRDSISYKGTVWGGYNTCFDTEYSLPSEFLYCDNLEEKIKEHILEVKNYDKKLTEYEENRKKEKEEEEEKKTLSWLLEKYPEMR